MPSASAMQAIVLAVPMTAQVPAVVARVALDLVDLLASIPRRRGTSPRSGGNRCTRPGARRGSARSTSARRRSWIAGQVGRQRRPSAGPAPSCRSRRPARPRPSAGRGSSPRRPSTSGCGTCRLVGLRNTSPSEMVGNSIGRPPGGEHAALHRLDQLREVAMAVVEAARRVGDADDRLVQHLRRVAHRAWRTSAAGKARNRESP